ncbi:MAG: AMP-binding protein [Lentisphaerae bacterium]|nr:AMP-binding protein [Lentisphaerota bacterium]
MVNPQTLGVLFDTSCKRAPQLTALIYSDGQKILSRTFAELATDVNTWCNFLQSKGLKCGDRVVAISSKSPLHYVFFYACWKLGLIAVPVCESLGDQEMSFIINDCEPSLLLADTPLLDKVRNNAGGTEVIDWQQIGSHPQASAVPIAPLEDICDQIAVLIYTSGSTGLPKGVMLTHRNIWVNAWSALEFYQVGSHDRLMSLLPYWHAYALVCEVCCTVMGRCTCAIPRDIRDFKRNIINYRPTIVIVVPRIVDGLKAAIDKKIAESPAKAKALIEKAIYNASRIYTAGPRLNGGILRMVTHHLFYDPLVFRKFRQAFGGRVRYVISGGAPLDLEHQIFFKYIGMPLFQGYGLTEASPVVSANTDDKHRLGSCGTMVPWLLPEHGGDYTFKDESGKRGKDLHGQLLVKGQCVMKGYWRHADTSAKTLEDGWLNTGDFGYCDKEGFLFIHGRMGNMIVLIGGEKLHPEHVEDAVKTSPMISEAMVIGEKCKNVYVCANVPEEVRNSHTPEALHDLVKAEVLKTTAHMAAFQKPKDVLILPDFNMEDGTLTATYKIRRHRIHELYKAQIEDFLVRSGEEIATKRNLTIASSRVVESLEPGSIIVGNGNILK